MDQDSEREGWRQRQRAHRERERVARAEEFQHSLEETPATSQDDTLSTGNVRAAVRVELDRLPLASQRPVDALCALRMAELLDSPVTLQLWPQASTQLMRFMEGLRAGQPSPSSPLTQLRAARSGRNSRTL